MLSLAVISAVGRELRDATAGRWLRICGERTGPALAGKLAPYILIFTLHGVLSLLWLEKARGWNIGGSIAVLIAGQLLLYLAYALIGVLVLGVVKRMSTALSVAGIYAGTGLAFCGGIFPVEGAPLFTRIWSALLPFSAYVRLQTQQLYLGASWQHSLWPLAALVVGVLVPLLPALLLMRRNLPQPQLWGVR